jgi:hypothetical protein
MHENKKIVGNINKLPFKVRFNSFLAGIKRLYIIKKEKIKRYILSNNFQIPKNTILKILFDGLLFTIGLAYFLGFVWYMIPITGCGWYILKKEILPELKQIFSSINLINIHK